MDAQFSRPLDAMLFLGECCSHQDFLEVPTGVQGLNLAPGVFHTLPF